MKKCIFTLLFMLPILIACGSDDGPDYEAESLKREQWLIGQWSNKKEVSENYEVWKFRKDSVYEWYIKPRGKEGIKLIEKGTLHVKRVNNYYMLFLQKNSSTPYTEHKLVMNDDAKFILSDVTFLPDNAEYEIIEE